MTAADDIAAQLAIWGWAVGRGTGNYRTPTDRFHAEAEVAVLEGIHMDGWWDNNIVDLFRANIIQPDGTTEPPPQYWALAGYPAWRQRVET